MILNQVDPIAIALAKSIHAGDLESLKNLLAEHPGLAAASIRDAKGCAKTPLHMAADWPGYFPNAPKAAAMLLAAGADPNAPVEGSFHSETALHWAASSDDVDVALALIEGGANLEAKGASIAGGTPLDDAVGYGCWRVARLLVARSAKVDKLWHAGALGMLARLEELLNGPPKASAEEINHAFWQACHGGQLRAAQLLHARGADLNWIPDYAKQTPVEIASSGGLDTGRQALVNWLRGTGAKLAAD